MSWLLQILLHLTAFHSVNPKELPREPSSLGKGWPPSASRYLARDWGEGRPPALAGRNVEGPGLALLCCKEVSVAVLSSRGAVSRSQGIMSSRVEGHVLRALESLCFQESTVPGGNAALMTYSVGQRRAIPCIKNLWTGLPWWHRLPDNARDTGLIPGPGRSHMPRRNKAHAPQLLSPRAATTEACAPRAHAPQQERPTQWEAHAQRRVAPARHN